ncbi:amino acid ABC transporter substrate-binding protein [Janthinobacterium fluminis]|uniref:Amino acid ABC transporter substrate-binding protein n=1 Tax=Janthinobacterium fluminis TaxID=2987524 RepID=A0ABT5JVN7_9BURK|nr:amino acid ABC transporter substrate-binding protein [Janthinobacterium fluminis]MDC8756797.1 amino acid ABC transporter substrate-binding protein [Janthinobacterium fluminis]
MLATLLCCGAAAGAGVKVVYPADEAAGGTRFNDLIELLQQALEKTAAEYGPFELRASHAGMTEARYLAELKSPGREINIAWTSTSKAKERELLPLRIPLRKGLLGYRIALIAQDKQALVDQVDTIEDLRKLTFGQGLGWGDTELYEANGIHVSKARYENLFAMTALGRVDIFPRGISEIFVEHQSHVAANPTLAIEKNLLIYYPWPYYFFFNRQDAALKARVESGLRTMLTDGSFDLLFRKYHGLAIEQAELSRRRVIRIDNDMLPPETPLNDPSLWFDPSRY